MYVNNNNDMLDQYIIFYFFHTGDHLQFCLPKKIEWYIKISDLKCWEINWATFFSLQLKEMTAIFNLCVKYWSNYL